jgi:phage shock protein A
MTLAALIEEGTGLGDPLLVSAAGAWPEALAEALSRSYPERLERLAAARRAAAAAATLVQDIQDQARELESAKAELEGQHRQAVDAGKPQEAAQAARGSTSRKPPGRCAAAAAELQRLLPTVIEARNRLGTVNQQMQARIDAFRTRKEVLKATYAAAQGTLRVHEAIAASGLAGDDAGEQREDTGETINRAQAAGRCHRPDGAGTGPGRLARRPDGTAARSTSTQRHPHPVRRRAARHRIAGRGA